jgi:hypothetical protein
LKKNGTSALSHWSRSERAHSRFIGRLLEPVSAPQNKSIALNFNLRSSVNRIFSKILLFFVLRGGRFLLAFSDKMETEPAKTDRLQLLSRHQSASVKQRLHCIWGT